MLGAFLVLSIIAACWVPRDPNRALFIGALIGAGASLIGGALNRKAQKKANAANTPAAQVAAWERAGVNPEFGISQGQYIPQQAASIGDSFAQAGAIFGESVSQNHAEKLKETETKKENQKLRKELDKLSKGYIPSHLRSYGDRLPIANPSNGPRKKRSVVNDNPNDNNAITLNPGEFKMDGEADRLDIDKGGSPKEDSIYQIRMPWGNWNTSAPMHGERTEGYLGDVLQIPAVIPQVADDFFHNSRGDYFDAAQQTWRKTPRGMDLEPEGSDFATILPKPGADDGFFSTWKKNSDRKDQQLRKWGYQIKKGLTK